MLRLRALNSVIPWFRSEVFIIDTVASATDDFGWLVPSLCSSGRTDTVILESVGALESPGKLKQKECLILNQLNQNLWGVAWAVVIENTPCTSKV